jgi:hypothetical protein
MMKALRRWRSARRPPLGLLRRVELDLRLDVLREEAPPLRHGALVALGDGEAPLHRAVTAAVLLRDERGLQREELRLR